jgi:hypothetical protein
MVTIKTKTMTPDQELKTLRELQRTQDAMEELDSYRKRINKEIARRIRILNTWRSTVKIESVKTDTLDLGNTLSPSPEIDELLSDPIP